MKVVIQRVKKGAVLVDGKIFSQIDKGYVILVGFCQGDDKGKVEKMAEKILNLRIMADENEKMNYNISQVNGELLIVSQFTLCADTSQRRPSFISASKEDEAKILYDYLIELLKNKGLPLKTGKFGAYMTVEIINDGPVTIVMDL
jgi:D-tyrosyl-tRNA(Tyr) deacylase